MLPQRNFEVSSAVTSVTWSIKYTRTFFSLLIKDTFLPTYYSSPRTESISQGLSFKDTILTEKAVANFGNKKFHKSQDLMLTNNRKEHPF